MNSGTVKTGDHSPWGRIDHVTKIAEGICFVSTSGHGGIFVSRERLQAMPEPFKSFRSKYGDVENGFYEEDCDWVIPTLAFATEMDPKHVEIARKMVQGNSGYYKLATTTTQPL